MQNNKVTIIMYHFVRDLIHSRYPEIKGLDTSLFREQIEYLKKHYNFITMEMLIDSIDNNVSLPEKAVLLTFDDAYIDHFTCVYPILNEHKIQGSFFPSVKAIKENVLLDVNKIHFILASEKDKSIIISEIRNELLKYKDEYNLKDFDYYYSKLAKAYSYDTAEVIFIKRLLQVELDESLRTIITTSLFKKIVGIDEKSFSKELYMNVDQIKCMHRNGMHIGNHGYDHYWLNSLSKKKQREEIIKSNAFLKEIGVDLNNWTMCYPYGRYNESMIEVLKEFNCKLALTVNVAVAQLNNKNRFELPRLDTNDIPTNKNAKTNKWYKEA